MFKVLCKFTVLYKYPKLIQSHANCNGHLLPFSACHCFVQAVCKHLRMQPWLVCEGSRGWCVKAATTNMRRKPIRNVSSLATSHGLSSVGTYPKKKGKVIFELLRKNIEKGPPVIYPQQKQALKFTKALLRL